MLRKAHVRFRSRVGGATLSLRQPDPIEKSPNDFWALGIRGTAYRQFSYLSQALDDFNQVIKLDPDNPWWLYSRALTHQLRGQVDSAQLDLAMTLQMASSSTMPTDIPSRLNLALYFLATKDVRQALAIYKEVLPALSPWVSKSTVREWKELFAVIPIEVISPPHSPETTMKWTQVVGQLLEISKL